MKLLHTADWHLGARLGRLSRAEDLRAAVDRVFAHAEAAAVDVLLIAGDLFHQGAWTEDVRDAVEHLKRTAAPFLRRGGTILAVTGNHDHEVFSSTLRHALDLADPAPSPDGDRWSAGRFHLATRPSLCRLPDPAGGPDVQFALLPYPTAGRYLDAESGRYASAEEKHRRLAGAFSVALRQIREHKRFDPSLASVLVAHVYARGATLPTGRESTDQDDVICPAEDLAAGWSYVALGHIHRAQSVGGHGHVRYSGSIERLRLDERTTRNGVVLVEIGGGGVVGGPETLTIEATPILDVPIDDPADLDRLEREMATIGRRSLARVRLCYRSGRDDLDALTRRVRALFPRCYSFEHVDVSVPDPGPAVEALDAGGSFRTTVLDYLTARLGGQDLAPAVLAEAELLLADEDS